MQSTLEKPSIDIRDEVPTRLEVQDRSGRIYDETGRNYRETVVTGYVSDSEDSDEPAKIEVGYIEASEVPVNSGWADESITALLISGTFMHKEVFTDYVFQDRDDSQERTEEAHGEAVERIMELLHERLFGPRN